MRLALHTAICCCVIAAVLPVPVDDAAGDASLKKRIRAWLQHHMRTDPEVAAGEKHSDAAKVQQVEKAKTASPPSRHRRAASAKAPGCFLFACAYHNLLSRLDHFNSKRKAETAPESRMSPSGYGRRRRRSPADGAEAAPQTDDWDSEEALPVCSYSICRAA